MSRHLCDGDNDCPSGSDEKNCSTTAAPTTTTTTTAPTTLKSTTGATTTQQPTTTQTTTALKTTACTGFVCLRSNKCVPRNYTCDTVNDCEQGEDESCCSADKLLCPTQPGLPLGKCIARRTLCDGFPDCPDGFDELNCPSPTTKVNCT